MGALDVLAVFGAITSLGLFAAPGSNIWRIVRNWSVEGYTFPLYPFTLLNCVVWVFYGTTPSGTDTILGVNGAGALLATGFVVMYLWVAFAAGAVFWKSLGVFFVLFIAGGVVAGLGFGGVVTPVTMFGYAGAITTGLMYFGAIGDVCEAFRAKNVASLSLLVIVVSLFNSILWTAYGYALKPKNNFIAVPNSIGVLAAVCQLAVYIYYNNIYNIYNAANADDARV